MSGQIKMPRRKNRYFKITALMLTIMVLGIGLTPSFADCRGTTSCCKGSENHGTSHHPVKLKISEAQTCSCGPQSTCGDISTNSNTETIDCLLAGGGRVSHFSYTLSDQFSICQSSLEAHESRFRKLLVMGTYSADPLYLANLTLLI